MQRLDDLPDDLFTLPNAITISGYAMQIAWLRGAKPIWAVGGLIADEVDGAVARATDSATIFGSDLDWAADVTMTGLVANRLGILWLLPFITGVQAYMRASGKRPAFGSARAALTVLALVKERKTNPVFG